VSAIAWDGRSLLRMGFSVVMAALTAFVGWVSSGRSVWLRRTHTTASEDPTGLSMVSHVRKVGARMPTPYPDAWYALALSDELAPGQVISATACNHNLVVWRPHATAADPRPAAVVMDAYCPHLGAWGGRGGGGRGRGHHAWCIETG
jgi:hypothetical protein